MMRTRIDYGIDLGTTNSALARMESGEPIIKKTDVQKDTLPSCVGFNRKKSVIVGDPAANALRSDTLEALKAFRRGGDFSHNFFLEFKRTMGTDKVYSSSHAATDFSSEALSAEVLKKLRTFVLDDDIRTAVITVPAKFTANQKDATMRAARLAGFEHFELLQEPIAAAMAYGLDATRKDGRWLVFDFGGGTFDAALIRADEGIIRVEDTEGDNYLGGKNLDLAAVDDILVPYLSETYSIDSFLEDAEISEHLRQALKVYVEPARTHLSFNDFSDILSDPGDFPDDDEGNEIELDLKLTSEMLFAVERPIFQRAIDICNELLKRNGLRRKDLDSLILVGGPTYSPNLRQMLKEQVTEKIDTSIDPMTAVARGAALYASTISVPESIRTAAADQTKVQLDIGHEATSVETSELITIKVAGDANHALNDVQVELERGDRGWSSGRCTISELGEVIEVQLETGRANFFTISLFDQHGNRIQCEPDQFTILQGTKPGSATLPYHFGIELRDVDSGKLVFLPLPGLEKNKSYPAIGVKNDLKTQKPAGPNMGDILIPIYEGDAASKGTRAIFSEHVYDAVIKGVDLKAFLPADSPVELTVTVVRDGEIKMKAYFPTLDDTITIPVATENVQSAQDSEWLYDEIEKARLALEDLSNLGPHVDGSETKSISEELDSVQNLLDQAPEDYDRRMQVRNNLREVLRKIDKIENAGAWPAAEEELRSTFERLDEHFESVRSALAPAVADRFHVAIGHFREQVEAIVRTADIKSAKLLVDEMNGLGYRIDDAVHGVELYISLIQDYDKDFELHDWSDRNRARMLVNQGLGMAASNPTRQGLIALLRELFSLLPESEQKSSHLKGDLG